jgi:hypothetical protein
MTNRAASHHAALNGAAAAWPVAASAQQANPMVRMGVPMVRMGMRTAGCRPGNDDRAPPMRLLTRS